MEKIKLLEKKKVNLNKIVELLNNKTISFNDYQQENIGIIFDNKYFIKGFFSINDLKKHIEKKYCTTVTKNNNIIYIDKLGSGFLKKLDQFSKIKLNYFNNNKKLNTFSFSKKDIKKINELYGMGIKTIKYKDYEIDFEKVILNYEQKKKDECIKQVFNLNEYNSLISGMQSGTITNNIEKESKLIKLVNIINDKTEKLEEGTLKHTILSKFSIDIMKDLFKLRNTRIVRTEMEKKANEYNMLRSANDEIIVEFTLNGSIRFK